MSAPFGNPVAGTPITEAEWAELRRASISSIDVVAGAVGLPAVLLPYQQFALETLEDRLTRVLFVEKSRRIGLTWGLAAYAVLRAAREKSAGGMDAMYISYSREMTLEFVDACAMWARAFALAAGAVGEFLFDDANPDDPADTRKIQAFRIRFTSGFEIVALSSAPRTLRGKQGIVIIDEAAFVDSLKEVLKAALAFLMWGGQVIVCSTHNGAENAFNEEIQDILAGRSNYSHLRIDFDQALQDGLYQRICLVTGDTWSPEAEAAWRQSIIDFYRDGADEELFCIPTQGSGAWLSGPLIESRMTADAPILRWELPGDFLQRPQGEQDGMVKAFLFDLDRMLDRLDGERLHGVGFDFARVADLSVLWLLSLDKTTRRVTVGVVEMRRIPHREQARVTMRSIERMPHFLGGAFDATGAGEFVAEEAVRKYGAAPKEAGGGGGCIAALKLSADWYRTEMPPLKAAFEDGMIAIPRDDEILADLRLVKVIKGVPRVPDVRTGEKGKRRHGDAAIALALAYYATRMRVEQYGYMPVHEIGGGERNPWDLRDVGQSRALDAGRRDGLW